MAGVFSPHTRVAASYLGVQRRCPHEAVSPHPAGEASDVLRSNQPLALCSSQYGMKIMSVGQAQNWAAALSQLSTPEMADEMTHAKRLQAPSLHRDTSRILLIAA